VLDARAEIAALSVRRVAAEYGLRVEHIAPAVILDILRAGQAEHFGARPDEYAVDRLLGDAFTSAAGLGMTGSVRVVAGPPPTCEPIASSFDTKS
jgi:hypothetical protein